MSVLAKSGNFFPIYEEETRLRRILEAVNSLATYVFTRETSFVANPGDTVITVGGTGAPIPGWEMTLTVPVRAQALIWFTAVVECSVYAPGAGMELYLERTNSDTLVTTLAATARWDPGVAPGVSPAIQTLVGVGFEGDLHPASAASPPLRYKYAMRGRKITGGGATYTVLAADSNLIIKTEGLVL